MDCKKCYRHLKCRACEEWLGCRGDKATEDCFVCDRKGGCPTEEECEVEVEE